MTPEAAAEAKRLEEEAAKEEKRLEEEALREKRRREEEARKERIERRRMMMEAGGKEEDGKGRRNNKSAGLTDSSAEEESGDAETRGASDRRDDNEEDDDLIVESTQVNIQVVELAKLNLRRKAELMQVAWNKLSNTAATGGPASSTGAGDADEAVAEAIESDDGDEPLKATVMQMKKQMTKTSRE